MTTKILNSPLLLLALSLLFLHSCKKDKDDFIVDSSTIIGSTTWVGDVDGLTAAILPSSLSYTLVSPGDISLSTSSSSKFTLSENALLDANGEIVEGEIDATILEVLDKGNLIRNQISTTSNGFPLHLSAAFSFDFKQGVESLQLNPEIGIEIAFPTENFNSESRLFYGDGETSLWQDATPSGGIVTLSEIYDSEQELMLPAYSTNSTQLSWVAIANFLTIEPQDGYKISLIDLPIGLNAENTLAYLVFESYNTVIQLKSNPEGVFFVENIPADESVLLLTLSERREGELLIGQQNLMTKNYNEEISATAVDVISTEELEMFLNDL